MHGLLSKYLKLDTILTHENLAELFSEEDLDKIGELCCERYETDKMSRSGWEDSMSRSFKLALQVMEEKNYPFHGASNVKFPAVTIASIQFNARAYPALVNGNDLVNHRVIGDDPDGRKQARADRVSNHMSYQLLEEDEDWEEEMDKLLMALPILGCAFKKSYFDYEKQHNKSCYVSPENLVINYFATSLEDAESITEVLGDVSHREYTSRVRLGFYIEADVSTNASESEKDKVSKDRQGITPPADKGEGPYTILEQHSYLDLDGDGYEEPYIITFELKSKKVLRIVPRFEEDSIVYSRNKKNQIAKIFPEHYFTKYKFVSSPDGGIYELGFGALLGPINESINTILNQLIDAGTLANMPSGFIGKGARLRKGSYRFKPGEFKTVNVTADDIRKNIFLLPVKEPSGTLFNLLNLLIEYGERISGVTDMMVGKTPGQNTPATTAMAALEQGQKVFSGIYKRIYKSLTKEFRRLYDLNSKYLNPQEYFQIVEGEVSEIFYEDYQGDPTDIRPSADPSVASDQQELARAEAVRQAALSSGLYDMYQVEKRYLKAMKVPQVDLVLPPPGSENAPKPPEPPLKEQAAMLKVQSEAQYKMAKLGSELELTDAQIAALEAKAWKDLQDAEATDDRLAIEKHNALLATLAEKRETKQMENEASEQRRLRDMEGRGNN